MPPAKAGVYKVKAKEKTKGGLNPPL